MKKAKPDYFKLKKRCPYCHKADIKLLTHTEYYGKNYAKKGEGKIFVCLTCDARVGCHDGTDMPKGCLSDAELRDLRIKIHKIIDTQWKTKEERHKLYKKLGDKYGHPFHTGFLNNERARYILYDLSNQ